MHQHRGQEPPTAQTHQGQTDSQNRERCELTKADVRHGKEQSAQQNAPGGSKPPGQHRQKRSSENDFLEQRRKDDGSE